MKKDKLNELTRRYYDCKGPKRMICNHLERGRCHEEESYNIKGGPRRLEKSDKVWMIMMITASLIWAGAAEKHGAVQNDIRKSTKRFKTTDEAHLAPKPNLIQIR